MWEHSPPPQHPEYEAADVAHLQWIPATVRSIAFLLVCLSLVITDSCVGQSGEVAPIRPLTPEPVDYFETSIRPVLVNSCGACHDPTDAEARVAFLKSETAADLTQMRGLWVSVAEQLCNRTMPPQEEPQPTEDDRLRVATWIGDIAGHGRGTIRSGRRLRSPEDTPLCNLYLSMLHNVGIEADSFGDSTGTIDGLT